MLEKSLEESLEIKLPVYKSILIGYDEYGRRVIDKIESYKIDNVICSKEFSPNLLETGTIFLLFLIGKSKWSFGETLLADDRFYAKFISYEGFADIKKYDNTYLFNGIEKDSYYLGLMYFLSAIHVPSCVGIEYTDIKYLYGSNRKIDFTIERTNNLYDYVNKNKKIIEENNTLFILDRNIKTILNDVWLLIAEVNKIKHKDILCTTNFHNNTNDYVITLFYFS